MPISQDDEAAGHSKRQPIMSSRRVWTPSTAVASFRQTPVLQRPRGATGCRYRAMLISKRRRGYGTCRKACEATQTTATTTPALGPQLGLAGHVRTHNLLNVLYISTITLQVQCLNTYIHTSTRYTPARGLETRKLHRHLCLGRGPFLAVTTSPSLPRWLAHLGSFKHQQAARRLTNAMHTLDRVRDLPGPSRQSPAARRM